MDMQLRPIESGNPLLTDQEACEYLRIRQRQLYTWRMMGVIPFIRIGRSIRYRLRDLDAAVDALRNRAKITLTNRLRFAKQFAWKFPRRKLA